MNTISIIIFIAFIASIFLNFSENSMVSFFEIFLSYFLVLFVLDDFNLKPFWFFFYAGLNTALFIVVGAILNCSKGMLYTMFVTVFVNYFMVLELYYNFYSIISLHYVEIITLLSMIQLFFVNFGGVSGRLFDRLSTSHHGVVTSDCVAGLDWHGFKKAFNR